MMRVLAKQFFFAVLLLLLSFTAKSQSFSSEAELKKHAKKLFDNKEFVEASSYFSQLLSLYPKDPEYNFKYGTCLLFSDSEKEKAIKFLEFASTKDGVEPEVFFYLGNAYHLDYRFERAIEAYNKFIEKGSSKSKAALQPERQIEMCNNGKQLIRNITKLIVMEKKEVKESDFFRSYNLGDFGGKIIVKPDDFKTSFDLKQGEKSIMFLPSVPNKIFFASYGDNNKNGKDIFKVEKLAGGEWSKPQSLGPIINTPYDEDYPFMHPNGKTLYFSSKGHNSMGGFDIFKSEYDEESGTWSSPVNLDFAISSPDDDILFISDKEEEMAYFSSSRASVEGNITVYKINIDRKPEEYILVNGKFKTDVQNISATVDIKVHKMDNNELIGTFTAKTNGPYILKIPNGGRFKFLVETGSHPVQTGIVDVPKQRDSKPLKQEMELAKNESGVKLTIQNLFDEDVSEDDQLLALDLIKNQAKLDVNYDAERAARFAENEAHKIKDVEISKDNSQESDPENKSSISNEEITNIAYNDAEELKKEAVELNNEANFAFAFAEKKSKQAEEKQQEADRLKQEALQNQDQEKRKIKLEEANEAKKAAGKLTNEASIAFKLAEKSDADAKKKEKEAEIAFQYAKELEAAVNSTSSEDAIKKLTAQKEKLENPDAGKGAKDILSDTRKQYEEKQKEVKKSKTISIESKTEAEELKTEIQQIEKEFEKTKDKTTKAALSDQITVLKEEQEAAERKATSASERANRLEKEAEALNKDANLIEKMITEIQLNGDRSVVMDESQKMQIKERIEEQKVSVPLEEEKEETIVENNNVSENNVVTENSNENIAENDTKETSTIDENGKITDYASNYKEQLNEAEANSKGAEKEEIKAAITTKWAESISNEISLRKEKLEGLDTNERNEEEKRISELENQLKEKTTEAQRYIAASDSLKKQESQEIASNKVETSENELTSESAKKHFEGVADFVEKVEVTNQDGEIIDYTDAYIDQLDKSELFEDEFERERTKGEVLSNWSASASQEVFIRKENLNNLKGKEKKAEQAKIDELSNYAITKQIEADKYLANAEKIKEARTREKEIASNDIVQNNEVNTGNSDKEIVKENPNKEINKNEVFEEEINYKEMDEEENSSVTNNVDSNQNIENKENKKEDEQIIDKDRQVENSLDSYSSFAAKESFQKATSIMDEANEFTNQANNIRLSASSIEDQDEKNAQLNRANDLDKQSQLKKIEAATVFSDAARAEFNSNTISIEKKSDPENESEDAVVAGMLLEEADFYLKEAEQTRKKALENESLASKYNFLNKSIELEKTALEKQNKAMELLKIKLDGSEITQNLNTTQSKGQSEEPTKVGKSSTSEIKQENNEKIIALNTESAIENERGEELTRQAKVLEDEANDLSLKAENARKNKEKAELQAQSSEKAEQANVLKEEAKLAFEKAETLKNDANILSSNNQPSITSNSNEKLNNEEIKSNELPQEKSDQEEEEKIVNIQKLNELNILAQQKNKKGEELIKQSEELEEEAKILALKSEETKKKKDKAELKQQSEEKFEEAKQKRSEGEIVFENARKLEDEAKNISFQSDTTKEERNTEDNLSANGNSANNTESFSEEVKSDSAENKEKEEEKEQRKVALKSEIEEEKQKGIQYSEQAKELEEEAEILASRAEQSKKKKEKAELEEKSAKKKEEASSKKELAEQSFSNMKKLENELAEVSSVEKDSSLNEKQSADQKQKEYEERVSALKLEIEKENQKAIELTEQAKELEVEADDLASKAENTRKKKEKLELQEQSDKKKEEANSKQQLAEQSFDKVSELEKEVSQVSELAKKLEQEENEKVEKQKDQITFASETPLNEEKTQILKDAGEFENYSKINSEALAKKEQAVKEYEKAEVFRSKAQEYIQNSEELVNEAQLENNEQVREEKLAESEELNQKAKINESKADSIREIADNHQAEYKAKQVQADGLLQAAIANSDNNKDKSSSTEIETSKTNSSNKYQVPKVLTEEIFDKAAEPVYSAKNPIPVDVALPEGLVYKVQIGAFRNPIPFDLFKGFAPIMGESTSQGFTRYTAGMFKSLETAILARDVIRGNGYKDAFVVVFYNGKRISMNEADALIKSGKANNDKTIADNNSLPNNGGSDANPVVKKENSTTGAFDKQEKVFPPDVAPYHELNAVKGLLYTVQVGVYTRPVPPSQLFNIQPLYVEKTPNTMLRYTSGIFDNTGRANEAKNKIVSIGIKDAFVTAYFDGARISVSEAKKIEAQNPSVFVQSGSMNVLPGVSQGNVAIQTNASISNNNPQISNQVNEQAVTVNKTDNDVNEEQRVKNGDNPTVETDEFEVQLLDKKVLPELEFKVQIGAFQYEVPLDIATKFLKISYLGINHYINEEGLTVYTVGQYFNYSSAKQMKNQLAEGHGFPDAFVVAYYQQKKISINQALELLKK